MFAQLGNHIFQGLKSPIATTGSYAVKYGRIAIWNGKDDIQPTGDELDEMVLTIQYSVEFCEPSTEIDALKKSMIDRAVLPFIMGDGTIRGTYVITNIEETIQRASPVGVVEIATVVVSLLEQARAETPRPTGLALASQKPTVQAPAPPVPSPSNEIAADLTEGKNSVNRIKAIGEGIKKGTTELRRGVREAQQLAADAGQAYATAKTKVEATKKIIQRAGDLPTSLDDAIRYANNLAKLDNVTDVSVLQLNIEQLTDSADKVTQRAAPVVAFSATREGGN